MGFGQIGGGKAGLERRCLRRAEQHRPDQEHQQEIPLDPDERDDRTDQADQVPQAQARTPAPAQKSRVWLKYCRVLFCFGF